MIYTTFEEAFVGLVAVIVVLVLWILTMKSSISKGVLYRLVNLGYLIALILLILSFILDKDFVRGKGFMSMGSLINSILTVTAIVIGLTAIERIETLEEKLEKVIQEEAIKEGEKRLDH